MKYVARASVNDPRCVETLHVATDLWRGSIHVTSTVARPLVHRLHVLTYHPSLGRVAEKRSTLGDRFKLLMKLDDLRL